MITSARFEATYIADEKELSITLPNDKEITLPCEKREDVDTFVKAVTEAFTCGLSQGLAKTVIEDTNNDIVKVFKKLLGDDCDCPKCRKKKAKDNAKLMPFGEALEQMKKGKRLARKGWNGNGMFAYYVEGNNYPAQSEAIKGYYPNDMVEYRPYLALKTAQDDVTPWTPSTSDILATDWYTVD